MTKTADISTVIVDREASSTDRIWNVRNYARRLEEDFAASFVHVCVLGIASDMMSSNFMVVNSKAVYTRYIGFIKMKIKNEGILFLSVSLYWCASGNDAVYQAS